MLKERKRRTGLPDKETDDEPKLVLPQLAKAETKVYTPGMSIRVCGLLHFSCHFAYVLHTYMFGKLADNSTLCLEKAILEEFSISVFFILKSLISEFQY